MEPRDKSPMEPRDQSPSPKTQPKKKGVTLVVDRPVTDRTREGYFGERRVSMAESVRRQSWFDQARINSQAPRRRGMLLHEVRFPATFNGLYCARFSPGGDLLATSFGVGAIQIRSPETGKLIGTLRSGLDQGLPIMCMRFHPVLKHKFYAASVCGNVFLCDSSAGEFSKFVEEKNNEVNAVDVDRTGTLVATAGKDAVVRLYDSASNKRKHEYRKAEISLRNEDAAKFHHMRVYALRFHPNMTDILVTGSWDNSVKIWDVRVPVGCVKTIVGPHICGDAVDIRDNVILTGSWVVHSSLQTWDLRTGKLLDTIVPSNRPASLDGDFLYAVNYFDGDPYKDMVLAGGSGTGALEVISLKEKKVLGSFPVNKAIQAIDSYGKTIAFGGMESLLRIADFV